MTGPQDDTGRGRGVSAVPGPDAAATFVWLPPEASWRPRLDPHGPAVSGAHVGQVMAGPQDDTGVGGGVSAVPGLAAAATFARVPPEASGRPRLDPHGPAVSGAHVG